MTRPFLEGHVRSRVLALPQIEAMGNCDVVRLSSNERGRVTGVVIRRRDEPKEESVLSADLVVDATGRGSRAPAWLEELGYQRPTVETTLVRLGYASCIYHRPENQSEDWYGMVIQQTPPEGKRAGFLGRVEGNRWMCCLSGVLGDHPPTDQEGFLEFARSLPADDLYRAIRNAKPASKVMAYKYPSPERRRYEKLADFPDGFVVMGDASCSFNPLYGQGMTIAAMGAVALGEELASVAKEGDRARLGMSRRFQAKQAKIQDVPWMMGTTEDFRYPEVEGKRPFGFPAISWFSRQLQLASSKDPKVLRQLFRTMHMLSEPSEIVRPSTLLRVALASFRETPANPMSVVVAPTPEPVADVVPRNAAVGSSRTSLERESQKTLEVTAGPN
jgi:2-polyprenyl-6-methoxyphenol hydroxylase-like FAD-dependent oxidoreductase